MSCGTVRNSVLCNVRCKYIDAEDCILINVTADRIYARPGSIVYNIIDETEDGLDLNHGQVLAGVFSNDGTQLIMRSATTIDGGKAWKQELEWNPKTFEDVYLMNETADPISIERRATTAHSSKWKSLTGEARMTTSSGGAETPPTGAPAPPTGQPQGSDSQTTTVAAAAIAARDQELMNTAVRFL